MGCKLTLSLLSESQEGDVGDDWKYTIEAQVFSGALVGEGQISVAKHKLASGTTQEPHGAPAPVSMPAGDFGGEIKLNLKLIATEVDLFKNDTGEHSISLRMKCPDEGGASVVEEHEVSVGVVESPGQMRTAVFTVKIRAELGAG